MVNWSPWEGCNNISDFCTNCQIKRNRITELRFSKDNFNLPLHTVSKTDLTLKYPSWTVFNVCPSGNFFSDVDDSVRELIWNIMKIRYDCIFVINVKCFDCAKINFPDDWRCGWGNVVLNLIASSQQELDELTDLAKSLPFEHVWISIAPATEKIVLPSDLKMLEYVCSEGDPFGEFTTDFAWHSDLARQCEEMHLGYTFLSTGNKFKIKDKTYTISKYLQQQQAMKANINVSKTVPKMIYAGIPFEADGFRWKILQGMLIPIDVKSYEIRYDLICKSASLVSYGNSF